MIHVFAVFAVFTAQPGQRAALLELFQACVPKVKAEAGCIAYGAAVDAAGLPVSKGSLGPDTFAVVETWESLPALQAHGVAPHMKDFAAASKPLVASRVIHVLEPA